MTLNRRNCCCRPPAPNAAATHHSNHSAPRGIAGDQCGMTVSDSCPKSLVPGLCLCFTILWHRYPARDVRAVPNARPSLFRATTFSDTETTHKPDGGSNDRSRGSNTPARPVGWVAVRQTVLTGVLRQRPHAGKRDRDDRGSRGAGGRRAGRPRGRVPGAVPARVLRGGGSSSRACVPGRRRNPPAGGWRLERLSRRPLRVAVRSSGLLMPHDAQPVTCRVVQRLVRRRSPLPSRSAWTASPRAVFWS